MIPSTPKNTSSFLQSVEWESFQESLGREILRLVGVLVIRHDIGYGLNYLYCPRPDFENGVHLENFLKEISLVAKKEKSLFLKIDSFKKVLVSGLRSLPTYPIQPSMTTVIDLSRSEDELMRKMHEKTRYNVRLAERKGVLIKNLQFPIPSFQTKKFLELLAETSQRDGFGTHESHHYEKLLEVHSERFSNELFFAEYQERFLAAALVNFYRSSTSIDSVGGVATYLHGASTGERREIMAPHLLHWEIIREAKRRGYERYDFWGIDEKKWPGLTRFKLGFGGGVVEYPPPIDIILNRPLIYWLYIIGRRFLKDGYRIFSK